MNTKAKDQFSPPDDAVWFLPLGGSGEIGMNLNLYGTAGKWLMVDCGITFPDETTPGIEVIMPDISFIADRMDDLVGMYITHGHEDHLGAIEYLWPQLQCPIYTTPFTAEMIRAKLGRRGLHKGVRIIELPLGGKFTIGPFQCEAVQVTHSIPEAHMLALSTKHGTVLHTGDWKFDPVPMVGATTDFDKLKQLGAQGVMALVGDSTNALVAGHSGSELDVQKCFSEIFGKFKNRIAVTCFASNVARLKSIALAAKQNGRYVALVGRSLWRNGQIAETCGYLPEFDDFLSEDEAMQAPRDKVVLICTGCQGEVNAALARIATFDHPEVELEFGDTVIFSSRDIPGNEKSIARVQNLLLAQGIDLVTVDDELVHVSGHPAQQELVELYQMIRPKLSLPVHGELKHQMAHAKVAQDCQVPHTLIPENGKIICLGPMRAEIVAEVKVGRLGMDGKVLRQLGDGSTAKHRRKLSFGGAVVVTLVLNQRHLAVAEPQVTLLGVEDGAELEQVRLDIADVVLDKLEAMPQSSLPDDVAIKHVITQAVKRLLNEIHGKKPVLEINLVRI